MKRTSLRPLEPVMEAIRTAKSIALVCHVNPDGDTIGTAMALRQGLLQLGRPITMFCQDAVPEYLTFLPGAEGFRLPENVAEEERFDLLLCVDVSDEKRMGRCSELIARAKHTAQIDHHDTNTNFCEANAVDGAAPACALVAYELLERLGCVITPEIALCLAVALSTDTGHLVYNSTTPEAFYAMGELVEAGAPMAEAYRRLYRERPPRQVALLAKALETLTFHDGGRITSIKLSRADFERCGALNEDAEIIVNYGLDVKGVSMCIFAREATDGSVKLSFRAVPPCKVSDVAQSFGGGGHAQAAGATVQLSLDDAVREAVARMKEELEQTE